MNHNTKLIPITRIGKFFGQEDYSLEIGLGQEWLFGDMNFTLILYRVDRVKTKTDSVYGEVLSDGVKFLPPVELKVFLEVAAPANQYMGASIIKQLEPGTLKFHVYQKTLDDLNVDIMLGDYLAYYESEDSVRYYTVANDGKVVSDNPHTYGGYKPFYRTIEATWVSENEFRG